MSQKRDTKSLKQEPTIQLSDTPYQGFYAAITAELLILKLHFALKTSSNSQPADPSSTKPQHSWSRGICASSRRAQELQLHLVWQWQEDPDALTQQWDPQLALEERVDLLELAAQHLLLLWGWNAARGWLQAKKKKNTGKFNPFRSAPADGVVYELRSKWIRDPWRAAGKAKTWELLPLKGGWMGRAFLTESWHKHREMITWEQGSTWWLCHLTTPPCCQRGFQ